MNQKQQQQFPLELQIRKQFPAKYQDDKYLEDCIKVKLVSYCKFLILKLGLKKLNHKKIVQKVYQNYISQIELKLVIHKYHQYYRNRVEDFEYLKLCLLPIVYLKSIELHYERFGIGKDEENFINLGNCLEQLFNLQYLQLNLNSNDIGQNEYNLDNLSDCFKGLFSLQSLKLQLNHNNLWKNQSMKYLFKGLVQLQKQLRHLELSLQCNDLGKHLICFVYLSNGLQQLQNLKYLNLDLRYNDLMENVQNQKQISDCLQKLLNLEYLELGLDQCYLGKNIENIKLLGEGIEKLSKLKELKLKLQSNYLGENQNNCQILKESIDKLSSSLEVLDLELPYNQLLYKDVVKLCEGLKKFQRLKKLKLQLNNNEIGENRLGLQYIKESLEGIGNLEYLDIDIRNNGLERDMILEFKQNIQNMFPLLKQFKLVEKQDEEESDLSE